ncbi:Histone-lysine N-methyltransferase set9 [Smittium mucronatum]|uniref:Histone-lysine N-methyltransferase set9 n=1 Tax=Smittium mucronatum TaxID=133383 RepID=A0A1R0GLR4_9FUNG|nr:Histone-lysine N-methyltransferase set9 [Smittium mucronatum]
MIHNASTIDWVTLAQFDDILGELLLDSTGLPFKTRKIFSDKERISSNVNMFDLIKRVCSLDLGIDDAVEMIKKIDSVAKLLDSKKKSQINEFNSHAKIYLSIYLPDVGFEISETKRYMEVTRQVEGCVIALQDFQKHQVIKYCTGSIAKLADADVKNLEKESSDFSVIWWDKIKKMCLLLGPVRFVNFTILSSGAITFQATRDISVGEELLTSYGSNYFGIGNRECMCFTCESFGRGRYSEARIAADNLGYNPDGKMITRSTYKHFPTSDISSIKSLCTNCKILSADNDEGIFHEKGFSTDNCNRCIRHFNLYNDCWPYRTPQNFFPLKRKGFSDINDFYDSETGSSTTLVSPENIKPMIWSESFNFSDFDFPDLSTLGSLKNALKSLQIKRGSCLDFLANGRSIYGEENRYHFNPRLMLKGRARGTPVIYKGTYDASSKSLGNSLLLGLMVDDSKDEVLIKSFNSGELVKRPINNIQIFIPTEENLAYYSREIPVIKKKKLYKSIDLESYEKYGFYLEDRDTRLAIAYYENRFLAPKGKFSLLIKNRIKYFTEKHAPKENVTIKKIKLVFNRRRSLSTISYNKKRKTGTVHSHCVDFENIKEGVSEAAYHILKNDLGPEISNMFDLNIPLLRYYMFFPKINPIVCNHIPSSKDRRSKLFKPPICLEAQSKIFAKSEVEFSIGQFSPNNITEPAKEISEGFNNILDFDEYLNSDDMTNSNDMYTKFVDSYCYGIGHKVKVLDTRDYRVHYGRIDDVSFINNSTRHGLYYYVHFLGWNKNFDSWVPPSCIIHETLKGSY